MFYGRIVKSTIDNPYDKFIDQVPGLKDNTILQLLEAKISKKNIQLRTGSLELLRAAVNEL